MVQVNTIEAIPSPSATDSILGMNPFEAQLIACVQENLDLYLYENACFYGERLIAEFPSEANRYLLATCHYRNNQAYRAFHLLQGCTSPQSKYLYALSCIQLGKLPDAQHALCRTSPGSETPMGAAGLYWLGRIHQLSGRTDDATRYYRAALEDNPLLWCGYKELCALDPSSVDTSKMGDGERYIANAARHCMMSLGGSSVAPGAAAGPSSSADHVEATPIVSAMEVVQDAAPGSMVTPPGASFLTPSPTSSLPHPSGPPPLPRYGLDIRPPPVKETQRRKLVDEGKLRKVSGRLFVPPTNQRRVTRQSAAAASANHSAAGPTPATHPDGALATSSMDEGSVHHCDSNAGQLVAADVGLRSKEGFRAVRDLLAVIVDGYRQLAMYNCKDAIRLFQSLPCSQSDTGWVCCQIGRAYFEMVDYHKAAEALQHARVKDPYRLEGMEVYSTVLWHMKREVELSHLAQECLALDRQSPYAWCVMGNCFSLQKEHEHAIKFFQRALQLDPTFTYAYTLCGHEYFANEDFEKAQHYYRQALRIDSRHYNAWYGLGQIYLRQEKWQLAEKHLRRALEYNRGSSVLLCYLGTTLSKEGKHAEALELLQCAISADPKNPLAQYERAMVLQQQDRYPEALKQLQALVEMIPREASVHFQMGKVCKRLGLVDEAMTHFCTALDLQPPASDVNLIKSAIDKIRILDDNQDEDV